MKEIVLLGASGSIGTQTIDVINKHADQYHLVGFSVGKNIQEAEKILTTNKVKYVCVSKSDDAEYLKHKYPELTVYHGDEGLVKLVQIDEYDTLVNALVGVVGMQPTYQAILKHKDIALANKETLVVAGSIIMKAVKDNNVKLYPIDSEHSAIFQCLQNNDHQEVKRLIITASGGSFRDKTRDQLKDVTVEQALAHPNWKMGAKITIDSATMMNKGFEVIEAHWLFDMPFDKIDVLVHQESVIHSLVEYADCSTLAQMANPDMRIPIQYALSYPHRLSLDTKSLDLASIGTLHFKDVEKGRYPLLELAYEVGNKQGVLPAVMNGANEVANAAFIAGKISFIQIEELIIDAVNNAKQKSCSSIADVLEADAWARQYVEAKLGGKI